MDRLESVKAIFDSVVADWSYLHRNAELSFEEFETSAYIAKRITELGVKFHIVNQTSIVAVLSHNDPYHKNTIALRADIDALPIEEDSSIENRSDSGMMHACGHDFHAASLLGAMRLIKEQLHEFSATFLFVFQQGEELLPGGAIKIIESGILDQYNPKMFIAQHAEATLNSGAFGIRGGLYMASGDELHLRVVGRGGHAALVGSTNNPIYPLSEMMLALKQVEKSAPEDVPTVVSIGDLSAQGATNIIPSEAKAQGTFRTMDETWRHQAKLMMQDRVSSIAQRWGVEAQLNIIKGYPMLRNCETLTNFASKALSRIGDVQDLDIRLTTEDFGEFANRYPSVFYRVGVKDPNCDTVYAPHTSSFRVYPQSLLYSVAGLVEIALSFAKL